MVSQDTNSSMNQERDTAECRTPTEAVRNMVIQWYLSGPNTSPERYEFMARLNGTVNNPIIQPIRSNPIIPPAISDQVAVSVHPLSPSPGLSHRMERSNITSITSQKRSQLQSKKQAGESYEQIINQDNAKKRKLRSSATPSALVFSPPPSPHLSAIPKTIVSINPNLPKVKIENDYNPIHAIKPDPELSSVEGEGRNARSQSDVDSDSNLVINIQAVLESSYQTDSALVPIAAHTKSVDQTNEVNYVPIIADSIEDVSRTDVIPKEVVPVESARDGEDADDVKGHSVPVVALATEVDFIPDNISQTETVSIAVVGVKYKLSKPVGAKVKAATVKDAKVKDVKVKTAKVKAAEPKAVKVKATNVNVGNNENLVEHQVIISSVPVVAVATEVSSNNIVQTETASIAVVGVESEPVGAKIKAAKVKSAKTAKVKAAKVKAAEVQAAKAKSGNEAKTVKAKATNVNGGNNENLMEHEFIISSQDNQIATDSSLIQNPVIVDANPPSLVFAEKKILEAILSLLPTSDLLNCRTLSHFWNSVAVPQLQERVQLNIYENNGPSDYKSKCRDLTCMLDGHARTFPLSPLPFKKLGLHKFTCQNGESELLWQEEQQLLTKHGAFVHELSLTSFPFSHGHGHNSEGQNPTLKEMQEGCLASEEDILKAIKDLLIRQTPNLISLTLDVALKLEGSDASDGANSLSKRKLLPMLPTDPVLHEIYSKLNHNPSPAVNTKFKFLALPFNMTHPVSAKLLEMIKLLAPNWEEIITREEDYIHFKHFSGLNFIKSLQFRVNTLVDLELFEKIAAINFKYVKNRLKLCHICLCLPDSKFQKNNFPGFSETEIKSRVVKVINIFLMTNKDLLETIEWDGVSFLPESEMWWRQSQIMPKICKLDLGNSSEFGVLQNVLPPAVAWPRLFPNLHCVSTRNIYLLVDCIKYLYLSRSNPDFESIKKIEIHSTYAISQENISLIEVTFPAARITL